MQYIGIDPGLDGGIATLSQSGDILRACSMPTIKLGKGRVVDVLEIRRELNYYIDTVVYLEEASKHSAGVLSLCSTWYTFGAIETILKLSAIRYQVIRPQNWQKRFWTRPTMAKGDKFDTKAAALMAATRLWPEVDWTKSLKARKPHDGMIDAALIAEFARLRECGKIETGIVAGQEGRAG